MDFIQRVLFLLSFPLICALALSCKGKMSVKTSPLGCDPANPSCEELADGALPDAESAFELSRLGIAGDGIISSSEGAENYDSPLFKLTLPEGFNLYVSDIKESTSASPSSLSLSGDEECQSEDTYKKRSLPTWGEFPRKEGFYEFCYKVVNQAAETLATKKSSPILIDVTNPDLAFIPAITTGIPTRINARVKEKFVKEVAWVQKNGPGILTIVDSETTDPTISADKAGIYTLLLMVKDVAGNQSQIEVSFIWRPDAPVFSGLYLSGPAADGAINGSEANSDEQPYTLSGSNFQSLRFSSYIEKKASELNCEALSSYPHENIPGVATIPKDGTFSLCVKLIGQDGVVTFGAGQEFIRSTKAPVVNAVTFTHEAADGAINALDATIPSDVLEIATDGAGEARYSIVSSATPCDGSLTYGMLPKATNASLKIEGTYKVCIQVADAYGNITFAQSDPLLVDLTPPVLGPIALIQDAADGLISEGEDVTNEDIVTATVGP